MMQLQSRAITSGKHVLMVDTGAAVLVAVAAGVGGGSRY
jgi:hypothetical protein